MPASEIEGKLKQFEDDDGEADDYRFVFLLTFHNRFDC
jgi:hypothetical protein